MADILIDNETAPTTPASSKSVLWVDSTSKKQVQTDDSGLRHGMLSKNASTASQALGTADTYVTNSGILIPSFGMEAGQLYYWYMFTTKTAAGTAAAVWTFRVGAAQTTADTSVASITSAAQTAAVDGGLMICTMHVRNVGASGVVVVSYSFSGKRAADAAGFGNSALDAISGTFANNAMGGQFAGISINAGASSAWTIDAVYAGLIS